MTRLSRLRLGFGALALLLWLPLLALVWSSLATLEREHELRHAAVANRVLGEAERALANFVAREEERPARDYRAPSPLLSSSPTASTEPFVRAYFEVEGDGRAHLVRGEGEALQTRLEAWLAELDEEGSAPAPGDVSPEAAPYLAQAPGSTEIVQNIGLLTGREIDAQAKKSDAAKKDEKQGLGASSLSSYDAIEEIERVAKTRSKERRFERDRFDEQRRSMRSQEARVREEAALADASVLADASALPATAPPTPRARARSIVEDAMGRASSSAPFASAAAEAEAGVDLDAAAAGNLAEVLADDVDEPALATPVAPYAAGRGAPSRRRTRIAPSRLVGSAPEPGTLLLLRSAFDERGSAALPLRQGLWVDVEALGRWVEEIVLGDGTLGTSIRFEFPSLEGEAATAPRADHFVYQHRFDAPFDGLVTRLSLAPLRDTGGARTVYWLAFLLLVASTLGLFALYRTVAVAIDFAERRSNFAASVSHELKTPLTAIRMYGEMLRDGMVSEEEKREEYYTTITTESERLGRLIDNVLEWSRIEKRSRELDLVSTRVDEVVADVARTLRPHAEARGFELAVELAADLPAARFEPDALRQILFNLVDNALKYASTQEPKRVEISVASEPGGEVRISVRDHGPGVPTPQLGLVFDAFYRAENELVRRTKGTGIGLALVRGLAEAMGGSAEARNHPDGGFEVSVLLRGVGEGGARS